MTNEREWENDKQRFVARVNASVPGQREATSGSSGEATTAADERHRLWSPLARQFAELGRELFAATTVGAVLDGVTSTARIAAEGASLASTTLYSPATGLVTPCATGEAAWAADQLQQYYSEGPFDHATRTGGTGMANSPDLAHESQWPHFGPAAAEHGMRSVISIGVFPGGSVERVGTLNVYSAHPRGLVAADLDVVFLLAEHAAAALAVTSESEPEAINAAVIGQPIRSITVLSSAAKTLLQRRHLPPGDAYDVLRRAATRLIRDLRAQRGAMM